MSFNCNIVFFIQYLIEGIQQYNTCTFQNIVYLYLLKSTKWKKLVKSKLAKYITNPY